MALREQVAIHLKEKGSITRLEALGLYGCMDITTVIRDLRNGCSQRKPMDIETEMKSDRNGKKYARYKLGSTANTSAMS